MSSESPDEQPAVVDTNAGNAAATSALGLDPLNKISTVKFMKIFNSNIVKKEIVDVYVSIYLCKKGREKQLNI